MSNENYSLLGLLFFFQYQPKFWVEALPNQPPASPPLGRLLMATRRALSVELANGWGCYPLLFEEKKREVYWKTERKCKGNRMKRTQGERRRSKKEELRPKVEVDALWLASSFPSFKVKQEIRLEVLSIKQKHRYSIYIYTRIFYFSLLLLIFLPFILLFRLDTMPFFSFDSTCL